MPLVARRFQLLHCNYRPGGVMLALVVKPVDSS